MQHDLAQLAYRCAAKNFLGDSVAYAAPLVTPMPRSEVEQLESRVLFSVVPITGAGGGGAPDVLTIIDTETDQVVRQLNDGDDVYLSSLPAGYAIEAVADGARSSRWLIDGKIVSVDRNGLTMDADIPEGTYTLTVHLYDRRFLRGGYIAESVEITVAENPPAPPPPTEPTVKGYGAFILPDGGFVKGQTEFIEFAIGPDFPVDGSITFQVWDNKNQRVIGGNSGDTKYDGAMLSDVPDGTHEVQALVRNASGRIVATVRAALAFVTPAPTEPPPPPPPVDPPDEPVPTDDVLDLPAPTIVAPMAGFAWHWRAPDASSASTYAWQFGDGESAQGMNVAHVYTQPGTYLVSLLETKPNGDRILREHAVSVEANTLRRVTHLNELADNTWLDLEGKTIDLLAIRQIKYSNIRITNGTIRWAGPRTSENMLLFTGRNVALENLTLDGPLVTQWVKDDPTYIGGNAKNLSLVNVTMRNAGHGLKSNGTAAAHRMSGVYLDNVTIDGMSSYPIWFEGTDLVVRNTHLANTWLEHLARITDAEWITLESVTFGGYVRGAALSLQHVANVSVIDAEIDGKNVSIGPLGSVDALRTRPNAGQNDRATNIRLQGGTLQNNTLYVGSGSSDVWIDTDAHFVEIIRAADPSFASRTWRNIHVAGTRDKLSGNLGSVDGLWIDGVGQ
jgi:hypothetical protein